MRSGLSTHAFANVGWDRLRRVAQLDPVDQSELSVAEELVDFVDDRACGLENAKRGHVEKLRVIAQRSVPKSLPSDQFPAFSRRFTIYFTPFFTIYFTRFFTPFIP